LEANPDVLPWTEYFVPEAAKAKMTPEELTADQAMIRRRGQLTKQIKARRQRSQGE
jgi:hypothetical protein